MASTSLVSKGSSRPTDDRTQLNELQAAGFSIPELRAEGFTDAQLLVAGYSAIDLISPPLSANPPPHLPEPLAIGATELVAELNARYTLGKPSSAVADAGVLVHQVGVENRMLLLCDARHGYVPSLRSTTSWHTSSSDRQVLHYCRLTPWMTVGKELTAVIHRGFPAPCTTLLE